MERAINAYLQEAHACYDEVAKQMVVLREMFPFPDGGTPNEPTFKERAVGCLKQARQYESEGANILRKMYERLEHELLQQK